MTTTTPALREILPVAGPSDIEDAEERDSLIAAVWAGHVHRESHCGEVDGEIEDFLRVIEYALPGTDTTRYALWRVQGVNLSYIHDSDHRAVVEAAYEEAVRDLADCDPDGWWAVTDVAGVEVRPDDDEPYMGEPDDDEDED